MSRMTQVKLPDQLPPMVASFLSSCDEVTYDSRIPIAATGLLRGKLTLFLGPTFVKAPAQVQREILKHEVGHFCLMHMERKEDRENHPWNIVCDAALHEVGCCDWRMVDAEIRRQLEADGKTVPPTAGSVTFDRLKIPPMPPEFAYDILMKDAVRIKISFGGDGDGDGDESSGDGDGDGKDLDSCGSMSHSSSDDTGQSVVKGAIVTMRIRDADPEFVKQLLGGLLGGHNSGGHRDVPDLTPPPAWIRETIVYLTSTMRRDRRDRSWMRDHRQMPGLLPGLARNPGKAARFFIDASGSIQEEQLRQFLSAVCLTPELTNSDVVVFDNKWSDPIPVTDRQGIVDAVGRMGGGTCIKGVGEAMRDPETSAVWITDGYTGDGWPSPHTKPEVWCVWGDGPHPNGAAVIRIPA